jgi:hypothetical protein
VSIYIHLLLCHFCFCCLLNNLTDTMASKTRSKRLLRTPINPNIIKAVSDIFNIALQDPIRLGGLRGSASTLGTIDEIIQGPGKHHLQALDELNMRGLASSFQFLPIDRGHATKMITWIPELITKIIEN